MTDFSKGLGQKDRTLCLCSWNPKQTTVGSFWPNFLIQRADSIRESISVFPGSICMKDLVWDASTLLSLPSLTVGIALPSCCFIDISCIVQGDLLNFVRDLRVQAPECSNSFCSKYVMFWDGCPAQFLEFSDFLPGGCLQKSGFPQLAIWLQGHACSFSEQVLVHSVYSSAPNWLLAKCCYFPGCDYVYPWLKRWEHQNLTGTKDYKGAYFNDRMLLKNMPRGDKVKLSGQN